MLTTSDYVHVFAFDFSKAFDAVRHHTLMTKMATLVYLYRPNLYELRLSTSK